MQTLTPEVLPITQEVRPTRPLGVTVLSVWTYGQVFFSLFLGFIVLFWPEYLSELSWWFDRQDPNSLLPSFNIRVLFAVLCLAVSLLSFLVARGFWNLRSWTRTLTIILCVLDLVAGGPPSKIIGRVISILIIWYLLRPEVKSSFNVNRVTLPSRELI
jgi:hypothetical protein